jgi:hypothetical protein
MADTAVSVFTLAKAPDPNADAFSSPLARAATAAIICSDSFAIWSTCGLDSSGRLMSGFPPRNSGRYGFSVKLTLDLVKEFGLGLMSTSC